MTEDNKYSILWKLTVALGMVGLLLGLLLRFYFVKPLAFNFKFLLHAHSHLMLLGWLFSGLLLLIYRQWFPSMPGIHYQLFIGLQISVFGMLLTFPFQGYGLYSIIFSTLHIIFSYVLLAKLWKHSRNKKFAGTLVRFGIVFHFLSTLGPYALGPIIANGLRGSHLYDQAIYFYLHFQYNGSFFFLLLALVWQYWAKANSRMNLRLFCWLMATGVVLTWAHSLEYSYDGWWINAAGMTGSVLQMLGGLLLFRKLNFTSAGKIGWAILTVLLVKWMFQLFGSFPALGNLIAQNRYLLIAWLHFIFLGLYTPFIWMRLLQRNSSRQGWLLVYGIFFLLTELALVLPSLQLFASSHYWPPLTFILYLGLAISWLAMMVGWYKWTGINKSSGLPGSRY